MIINQRRRSIRKRVLDFSRKLKIKQANAKVKLLQFIFSFHRNVSEKWPMKTAMEVIRKKVKR